jgi:peptide/nickel transport system substrate-binding protein
MSELCSPSTYTASSMATSTATASYGPSNTNELIDESPAAAFDSLDPGRGFFVTDGYFANVFQSLVEYNPYNSTEVVPALATGCTVGAGPLYTAPSGSVNNFTQWNFTMRANTMFSNKDPVNAYVAWFSFVRELYMNNPDGVGISNYASLTVNVSSPLDATPNGNIIPDGLQNALANAGLCTVSTTNDGSCVTALNYMLSNYNPTSNATQMSVVSYPDQAYVANSATSFTINLIQPYQLILLDIPAQWGALVDPVYLDSVTCGTSAPCGVANDTTPTATDANGMPGTGPYEYVTHAAGNSELTLRANPNYWGTGVSGLAPDLQPAQIQNIEMEFGNQPNVEISDFASNNAQIVAPPIAQFAQTWQSYHSAYSSYNFNQIFVNEGYPLCDLATGINTQYNATAFSGSGTQNYTDYTLVRQALVHAINYTSVLDQLYSASNPQNGSILPLGELFIPPVPPGWGPLDNPQNTPLYSYNITLATQDIAQAGLQYGFYVTLANGTKVGDTSGTAFTTVDYSFILPETPEQDTYIGILNQGLNLIGINLVAAGLTESQFEADTVAPASTPQTVGVGWCADWPDPIYQQFYDMATTITHQPNWVNNATLTHLLEIIPFETNATLQLQQTEQAYQIFTQLASIIQVPNSAVYFWYQPYLTGLVYSPFQFAIYYDMISYT